MPQINQTKTHQQTRPTNKPPWLSHTLLERGAAAHIHTSTQ